MQKASEVIGRSVVAREGGKTVGKVKEIVLNETGTRVLGFVVDEGLFKSDKVVPWGAVQAIGPDSVIITSTASVVKTEEAPEIKSVLDKKLNVRGTRLQTTTGKDLGKIDDYQFDESSGSVIGFELSGGVFADVFKGKSFLPTPTTLELGRELAFVGPEAEAALQDSSGNPREGSQ
ncbi:MAG: PRC-barrel domain-containing protein [Thermoleophilia bacterium]|nr:PRC-barrel domain-containing protein [Thermoleophilia bacterium]